MSVPALCVAVLLTTKIEAKGEQYQCGPWTPGDWMTWLCVSKMSVPWIWLLRMLILCALALQVFYRHLQTICHLHSRQNIRKESFMSWRSSFFFFEVPLLCLDKDSIWPAGWILTEAAGRAQRHRARDAYNHRAQGDTAPGVMLPPCKEQGRLQEGTGSLLVNFMWL